MHTFERIFAGALGPHEISREQQLGRHDAPLNELFILNPKFVGLRLDFM